MEFTFLRDRTPAIIVYLSGIEGVYSGYKFYKYLARIVHLRALWKCNFLMNFVSKEHNSCKR